MTVLVVSHMFPNEVDANCGIFVLEQIKALREAGARVIIISPTPWAPGWLKFVPSVRKYSKIPRQSCVDGFIVERPRIPTLPKQRAFSLSGFLSYWGCRSLVDRIVRDNRVDVIHAHAVMPDGFAAVLLGKTFRLPVVCTAHGSDVNVYPFTGPGVMRATRWTLRRVHRLITVSQSLKELSCQMVGGRQVVVTHNGADDRVFRPIPKEYARKELGLNLKSSVICTVGYLRSEKALNYLLSAFAGLRRPDAILCVVGDGPLRSELESQARDLGVADSCRFVGARPHNEVPLWLSAADCLVLCSLSEGLPTILPEAMLCRVPIVATDVGGVSEIVHDRETGLLIPRGDADAIRTAMQSLLSDSELSLRLVNRAEAFAKTSLTWKANARRTLSVYEDVIRNFALPQRSAATQATLESFPLR